MNNVFERRLILLKLPKSVLIPGAHKPSNQPFFAPFSVSSLASLSASFFEQERNASKSLTILTERRLNGGGGEVIEQRSGGGISDIEETSALE